MLKSARKASSHRFIPFPFFSSGDCVSVTFLLREDAALGTGPGTGGLRSFDSASFWGWERLS